MDVLLLVAVFALSGVDTGMSLHAFGDGYLEANPMLRPLQEQPTAFVAVKTGLTVAAVAGVWKATRHRPRARFAALLSVIAIQAIVVGINYMRIRP